MENKLKIIIADDSKTFLEGFRFIISRNENYSIIDVCCNGKELIDSPLLYSADIIITDIDMPQMNGMEAARIINKRYPHLPIVALTMHIESVFLKDLIESGFNAFIYKPNVSKKLHSVINQVLNNEFVFPENIKLN